MPIKQLETKQQFYPQHNTESEETKTWIIQRETKKKHIFLD